MTYYIYEGKLDSAARTNILKNASHFNEVMRDSVAAFGGKLIQCFFLSGSIDPIGFLHFDRDLHARSWSSYYGAQDGVLRSHIRRLLDQDELVAMHRVIGNCRAAAEAHRRGPAAT